MNSKEKSNGDKFLIQYAVIKEPESGAAMACLGDINRLKQFWTTIESKKLRFPWSVLD